MNKTYKVFTGIICLLAHNAAYSQDSNAIDENTIVMTEGELTELVSTIAKHRRQNILVNAVPQNNNSANQNFETVYLEKKIEELQGQLQLNAAKKNQYAVEERRSSDLESTNDEINELRQRLYAMEAARTNIQVITPGVANTTERIVTKTDTVIKTVSPIKNKDMLGLNKKLDSLQSILNAQKPVEPVSYQSDFDVLKNKLGELQSEMITSNVQPSNYEQLKNKYKGYKQELLFTNNGTTIKGTTEAQVNELFNLLNDNDNLDVVLKGFASAKGSATYNEKLSMDRTESVKKALVLQGLHPTRILTQYHGIDYKAISAETARRVEATILVRK